MDSSLRRNDKATSNVIPAKDLQESLSIQDDIYSSVVYGLLYDNHSRLYPEQCLLECFRLLLLLRLLPISFRYYQPIPRCSLGVFHLRPIPLKETTLDVPKAMLYPGSHTIQTSIRCFRWQIREYNFFFAFLMCYQSAFKAILFLLKCQTMTSLFQVL